MAKLARTWQAVEKYQKKLEKTLELQKQKKDQCERMDPDLESTTKGMTTLN